MNTITLPLLKTFSEAVLHGYCKTDTYKQKVSGEIQLYRNNEKGILGFSSWLETIGCE